MQRALHAALWRLFPQHTQACVQLFVSFSLQHTMQTFLHETCNMVFLQRTIQPQAQSGMQVHDTFILQRTTPAHAQFGMQLQGSFFPAAHNPSTCPVLHAAAASCFWQQKMQRILQLFGSRFLQQLTSAQARPARSCMIAFPCSQ
jgi:hypothetical protein